MNQASHLISSVSSRAKKEIRSKGGIHSHEKIYLKISGPASSDTAASFALRIFLSELFTGRRDIAFVRKETGATLILGDKTLDDTAEELLASVLEGTVAAHLTAPEIRTIHPFSGIPAEETAAYAEYFGWNKETAEASDTSAARAEPALPDKSASAVSGTRASSDKSVSAARAEPVLSDKPAAAAPSGISASSRVHDFLNGFSIERPSAKYALKNVSDKLHEKADILSLQIDNHERGNRYD